MTLPLTGAGPSAGSFDPLSLSPTAWWKADSLALSNGAAVSSWADSSGNSNTATQATGALQPTYNTTGLNSHPAVSFDGGDVLTIPVAVDLLKPFTFAAALKVTNFAADRTLLAGNGMTGIHIRINNTTGFPNLDKQGTAGIGTATTAMTAATPARLVITYDGSGNYAFFVNAVAAGSGTNNQTFSGAGPGLIGAAADTGASQPLIGFVGDMLMFNTALSTANRQSVETYLATKYGL